MINRLGRQQHHAGSSRRPGRPEIPATSHLTRLFSYRERMDTVSTPTDKPALTGTALACPHAQSLKQHRRGQSFQGRKHPSD